MRDNLNLLVILAISLLILSLTSCGYRTYCYDVKHNMVGYK